MNEKLELLTSDIEGRLVTDDILEFKIGITERVEERQDDHATDGYPLWGDVATGTPREIRQAETDLTEWALANPKIKEKCKSKREATERGQVTNASNLYIVAKPTPKNKKELEIGDLWDALLPLFNFEPIKL